MFGRPAEAWLQSRWKALAIWILSRSLCSEWLAIIWLTQTAEPLGWSGKKVHARACILHLTWPLFTNTAWPSIWLRNKWLNIISAWPLPIYWFARVAPNIKIHAQIDLRCAIDISQWRDCSSCGRQPCVQSTKWQTTHSIFNRSLSTCQVLSGVTYAVHSIMSPRS